MRQPFFAPCAVYSLRGRTPSNTPGSGLRPPKCIMYEAGRLGWEPAVLQVIENQLSINWTVPNLCNPISGHDYLRSLLRPILCKRGEI